MRPETLYKMYEYVYEHNDWSRTFSVHRAVMTVYNLGRSQGLYKLSSAWAFVKGCMAAQPVERNIKFTLSEETRVGILDHHWTGD